MRKIKIPNSLLWLYEPLEGDSGYNCHKLFSFDAAYLDGKLYLAIGDNNEPWNGLMVCTSHEHHAALQHEFPQLVSHKVLGKWLYISQNHPEFETVATEMVELAKRRDTRLGVASGRGAPKGKKPKSRDAIFEEWN